ncbi:hypothetical protein C0033_24000 [Clostridium sp. chh4-2]|nr:hypothetical protein C0033_24000 [Clostridium sp. chh4-2]
MPLSIDEKIKRNLDFWQGNHQERPLMIARLGGVFFSRAFEALIPLLERRTEIRPEEIIVDDFLPDYERMYQELEKVNHDAFFVAEPCTGLPWMECIMGAKAYGENVSVVTKPVYSDLEDLKGLKLDKNNPWYQKYLEFSKKLTDLSQGRFAVGQPILRGVTDTIGALAGQVEMACGLIDEPELMQELFHAVTDAQRELIADQYAVTKACHGGYGIGFYHIWTPDRVMWYQEDLAALMSPDHYGEYLFDTSKCVIEGYPYSLVHLHSASFMHLEQMLQIADLKAVQINRDVVGLSVREMLPQCKMVLDSGKRLVLGMGPIVKDDIDAIYDNLPHHGIAINMIAETADEVEEILEYVDSKEW